MRFYNLSFFSFICFSCDSRSTLYPLTVLPITTFIIVGVRSCFVVVFVIVVTVVIVVVIETVVGGGGQRRGMGGGELVHKITPQWQCLIHMGRLLSYGDGNNVNDGRMKKKKKKGSGDSAATNGNKKLCVFFIDGTDKIVHLFPKPNVMVTSDNVNNKNSNINDNVNGNDGNRYSSRTRNQNEPHP